MIGFMIYRLQCIVYNVYSLCVPSKMSVIVIMSSLNFNPMYTMNNGFNIFYIMNTDGNFFFFKYFISVIYSLYKILINIFF